MLEKLELARTQLGNYLLSIKGCDYKGDAYEKHRVLSVLLVVLEDYESLGSEEDFNETYAQFQDVLNNNCC